MSETETMMNCPNCGQEISAKAIACKYCGTMLHDLGGDTMETLVVKRPASVADVVDLADTAPFVQGTSKLNPKAILYLSIERVNTPLARYVLEDPILLGRQDSGDTSALTKQDINLSPYNARERGVSRKHARIFQQDGELYIEDLGSSNGTMLNDNVLAPNEPHKLRDGDEIMLGRMMVWVNF